MGARATRDDERADDCEREDAESEGKDAFRESSRLNVTGEPLEEHDGKNADEQCRCQEGRHPGHNGRTVAPVRHNGSV